MPCATLRKFWSTPAFRILFTKWIWICIGLIVVMQVIVASSTFWIVQLIHAIQEGTNFWMPLGLYLGSLTLPYLPGAGALVILSCWQMATLKKFVDTFIDMHQNKTAFWSDKNEKEKRVSLLTAEGQQTYNAFIEYLHRFFCCTLNVGLNILVLSFLVEPKFLIGYGLSLFLSMLLLKWFDPKQSLIAGKAQNARIELGQSLLQSWDNVLLGNHYNFDMWRGLFAARYEKMKHWNVYSARVRQILSVLFAFFTLAPCFLIAIYSMWTHRAEPMILSAFVVTLPRLFLILGFTHELIDIFSEWSLQRSRLEGINQILLSNMTIPLDERISMVGLSFYENGSEKQIKQVEELLNWAKRPCRITIRGANGSGKSSLLLLLKERLKEDAFYFPVENHLVFQKDGFGLSTGQGLKKKLLEIQENVDVKVLLLDEWDANLDASNQSEISQWLDTMVHTQCVIEVRHRD